MNLQFTRMSVTLSQLHCSLAVGTHLRLPAPQTWAPSASGFFRVRPRLRISSFIFGPPRGPLFPNLFIPARHLERLLLGSLSTPDRLTMRPCTIKLTRTAFLLPLRLPIFIQPTFKRGSTSASAHRATSRSARSLTRSPPTQHRRKSATPPLVPEAAYRARLWHRE